MTDSNRGYKIDEPEGFIQAVMRMMDERASPDKNHEMIDAWHNRAMALFRQAVRREVREYIGGIVVEVKE